MIFWEVVQFLGLVFLTLGVNAVKFILGGGTA